MTFSPAPCKGRTTIWFNFISYKFTKFAQSTPTHKADRPTHKADRPTHTCTHKADRPTHTRQTDRHTQGRPTDIHAHTRQTDRHTCTHNRVGTSGKIVWKLRNVWKLSGVLNVFEILSGNLMKILYNPVFY